MPSDPKLRAFLVHLAAYCAANAVMIVVNLVTAPNDLWFQWPLAGWGIGVAAHGLALLLERKAPKESAVHDRHIRGFAVHAFVYVAVNILLVIVNLVVTPQSLWFYWPLLGWGAGLAAHGYAVWDRDRHEPR